MSALLTACCGIRCKGRTLNRTGIEEFLRLGKIIEHRHVFAGFMCKCTVRIEDGDIGHGHIHVLTIHIDDEIRTLRHVDIQLNIAAVEDLHCFTVKVQHIQIRIAAIHGPSAREVGIDLECGIVFIRCKQLAAFIQQLKFRIKVDQLSLIDFAKIDVLVFLNERVDIFICADDKFLAVGLEIGQRVTADYDLCCGESLLQLCTDGIVGHRTNVGIAACGKSALAVGFICIKIPLQKDRKLGRNAEIVILWIVDADQGISVFIAYLNRAVRHRVDRLGTGSHKWLHQPEAHDCSQPADESCLFGHDDSSLYDICRRAGLPPIGAFFFIYNDGHFLHYNTGLFTNQAVNFTSFSYFMYRICRIIQNEYIQNPIRPSSFRAQMQTAIQ